MAEVDGTDVVAGQENENWQSDRQVLSQAPKPDPVRVAIGPLVLAIVIGNLITVVIGAILAELTGLIH